jgi:hypothetical protein
MAVQNYKVVAVWGHGRGEQIRRLEEAVKKQLQYGWQPQGGVSFSVDQAYYCVVAQAMVRRQPD